MWIPERDSADLRRQMAPTDSRYENGGASACFAYFTIQALRKGRAKEADAVLYSMMQAFEDGRFQGRASDGLTYDWMNWKGNPHGYEGLLVDGYLTLLAGVPTDHNSTTK